MLGIDQIDWPRIPSQEKLQTPEQLTARQPTSRHTAISGRLIEQALTFRALDSRIESMMYYATRTWPANNSTTITSSERSDDE